MKLYWNISLEPLEQRPVWCRHNIWYEDTQNNDTQHEHLTLQRAAYATQHNDTRHTDNQNYGTQHNT